MSLVKISGNASGTGTLTIAAPNTNTNRTLTLPDNTGTFLTSATTTGFPAGSVLQVVSASDSTYGQTTSTSFVDTTLTATITPTSATSKILVLSSLNGVGKGNGNYYGNYRIIRGASTQVVYLMEGLGYTNSSVIQIFPSVSCAFLDSPGTTSATTYKAQYASSSASFGVQYNWYVTTTNLTTSTITLMEIAA